MKIIKYFFTMFSFLTLFTVYAPVYAQNQDQDITVDPNIGLKEIRIPFFPQVNTITSEYASFLSWASFLANSAILIMIFFWIYRIIRAGILVMQKSADSEALAEAWKRSQSVFIGAGFSFLVPIVLSIIGIAINVGYVWDWPLAFRNCDGSSDYEYYFQALNEFGKDPNVTKQDIDNLCFGKP